MTIPKNGHAPPGEDATDWDNPSELEKLAEDSYKINWDIVKTQREDKNYKSSIDHIFRVMENLFERGYIEKADNILKEATNKDLHFENYFNLILITHNFSESLPHYEGLYNKTLEEGIKKHGEDIAKRQLTGLEPGKVDKRSIQAFQMLTGIEVPKPEVKKSLNEYLGEKLNRPIKLFRYSKTRERNPRI